MSPLRKYQRQRTKSKATKKSSTALYPEITSHKIQKLNPTPRRGNSRQTHSLNCFLSIMNDKSQQSKKNGLQQKSYVNVTHSHFLIKKRVSLLSRKCHRSKNFQYLKNIICQKSVDSISHYPNCVIM